MRSLLGFSEAIEKLELLATTIRIHRNLRRPEVVTVGVEVELRWRPPLETCLLVGVGRPPRHPTEQGDHHREEELPDLVGSCFVGRLHHAGAVTLTMAELTGAVKEGLLALAVGAALEVQILTEEDVAALAGRKGRHDSGRAATRPGSEAGSATLGGRRVPVRRPRVRSADGRREIPVQAYETFTSTEILGELALKRMMAKLSTRRYRTGLEPVGSAVAATATSASKSEVSQRFEAPLAAAAKAVFDHAVIQRCQPHKIRNVEQKLPDALASTVAKKMRAAYRNENALPPRPISKPLPAS